MKEHDRVRTLIDTKDAFSGADIPAGSTGIIVMDHGDSYEVETAKGLVADYEADEIEVCVRRDKACPKPSKETVDRLKDAMVRGQTNYVAVPMGLTKEEASRFLWDNVTFI